MIMINLQLHYGPAFSELIKTNEEKLKFEKEIELKDLLEFYYNKYGDKFKKLIWKAEGEYHDQLVIIINGNTYRDENFLKTPLKDGDDLYFLYIYFGG